MSILYHFVKIRFDFPSEKQLLRPSAYKLARLFTTITLFSAGGETRLFERMLIRRRGFI